MMSDPNRYQPTDKGWGRDDDAYQPRRRVRSPRPAPEPRPEPEHPKPRRRRRLFGGIRNLLSLIGLGTVIWLAARYAVIPLLVMLKGVMP